MTNSSEFIGVSNCSTSDASDASKVCSNQSSVEPGSEGVSPRQAEHVEQHEHHESVLKHKFVGRSREREEILKTHSARPPVEPPAEVLRWTEVLGLDSATFTAEDVHRAWRKQISSPDVHPDLGGELETAILLNTAKDSLTKWLDSFAPKLGKTFLHMK